MSSSTHPIILNDSNFEDAFSSTNIPNYTSASPNYSSTSPGNTYSDTSEDPSEDQLVPIAVSTFHDDLYMKVMQAYYATNELPIPPPPAPIAPPPSPAAIKKLVADSMAIALEAQVTNMANADNTNRNTEPRKAHVARKCSYKEFMSCQPFNFKAYKTTWSEFKKLLIKKYIARTKVKKMEDKFYNLTVKGNDLKTYVRRFQELAVLCPTMVPNSKKMMEVFIKGLPRSIKGNVTALKPQTLEKAITIT
nr:reverse transcriptase domain-containing protein [Tanacetum cinerariifolium]